MLAAAAALMITSVQAQDAAIEDLIRSIAHSQGVLSATQAICDVTPPASDRHRLTNILMKRDGKFMARVLIQVRDQTEVQYKLFGSGPCTQQVVVLMRGSANMLKDDLDELERRLSR
ncbi:hypothetical protein B6S44_14815 [Bosea sp. Tri-44]|nr:hypothetical protein B6S44_14815 [Bosea sp. Tri-44]